MKGEVRGEGEGKRRQGKTRTWVRGETNSEGGIATKVEQSCVRTLETVAIQATTTKEWTQSQPPLPSLAQCAPSPISGHAWYSGHEECLLTNILGKSFLLVRKENIALR